MVRDSQVTTSPVPQGNLSHHSSQQDQKRQLWRDVTGELWLTDGGQDQGLDLFLTVCGCVH